MPNLNTQKQKAQDVRLEINRIDSEIDEMVCQLYGLLQEEVKIIEQR